MLAGARQEGGWGKQLAGTLPTWTAGKCSHVLSWLSPCLARERAWASVSPGFSREAQKSRFFYTNSTNFKRVAFNSVLFLKHNEEGANLVRRQVLAHSHRCITSGLRCTGRLSHCAEGTGAGVLTFLCRGPTESLFRMVFFFKDFKNLFRERGR